MIVFFLRCNYFEPTENVFNPIKIQNFILNGSADIFSILNSLSIFTYYFEKLIKKIV